MNATLVKVTTSTGRLSASARQRVIHEGGGEHCPSIEWDVHQQELFILDCALASDVGCVAVVVMDRSNKRVGGPRLWVARLLRRHLSLQHSARSFSGGVMSVEVVLQGVL